MKINKPNKIIIHHSASGVRTTTKQISNWHKKRSFYYNPVFKGYVGYHFLIHANGRIEQTKLLKDEGCHCIGQNTQSIGICLIGNFEKTWPTNKQIGSLWTLLSYLNKSSGKYLPTYGHSDFSATKCCGKNLSSFVKMLNDERLVKLIYGYAD